MPDSYEKRGYLLEDFRLFHLKGVNSVKIDYHYHEFYKIFILVSGSGCYHVEGSRYRLAGGDTVLIGSRCVHKPEFESPYERLIIYISPDFLNRFSTEESDLLHCFFGQKDHVLRPKDPAKNNILSLALQLEQELASDHYGRDILSGALLLRLLVEIARARNTTPVQTPEIRPSDNGRISEILRYIDAHFTEDLTIEALADRFYLSKYHMMRSFRQETGSTIHAYILDRRLLLARDLIGGGENATSACYHAGFKSYSAFTRAYMKRFGTTPTGRTDRSAIAEATFE